MRSTTNVNSHSDVARTGIGRAVLKDVLVIVVAMIALLSFYFFVKAFSILANIP